MYFFWLSSYRPGVSTTRIALSHASDASDDKPAEPSAHVTCPTACASPTQPSQCASPIWEVFGHTAATEAEQILQGLAPKYERHHELRYTPEALKAAGELEGGGRAVRAAGTSTHARTHSPRGPSRAP